MGKTVRGIYENGEIRLLADPQITGKQEVYIVFPDDEKPRVSGIPASAFTEIDGIVAVGGNALEDSEGLWIVTMIKDFSYAALKGLSSPPIID